ncbi:MAG: ATPase, partial [Anaerolineae bacterium]|nr:ATPase [Anaerolineae bacterium]
PAIIHQARHVVNNIYVDDRIKNYILDIIFATRDPGASGLKELAPYIEIGASPRATIALTKAAKANAFTRGRGYVTPDDVKQIAPDVLRHRIIATFEAEAEGVAAAQLVQQIVNRVEVP